MIDGIEIIGLLMCITGGIAWVYFQYQTGDDKKF